MPTLNEKLLAAAHSFIGTHERAGAAHNPQILAWFADAGSPWLDNDEAAWCSAFVCGMAKQAGCHNPRTVRAKSWLDIDPLFAVHLPTTAELLPGDVVVITRGANLYHVSILSEQTVTHLWCLGGNQSNSVRVTDYKKSRFVGGVRLGPS